MLTVILAISIINLALGMGVAMYLKRSPDVDLFIPHFSLTALPLPRAARLRIKAAEERFVALLSATPESAATIAQRTEPKTINPDLTETIGTDAVAASSAADGPVVDDGWIVKLIQTLRLELSAYLQQIIVLEEQVREKLAGIDTRPLAHITFELQSTNIAWAGRLLHVSELLHSNRERFQAHRDFAVVLDEALYDQAGQITDATEAITTTESETTSICQQQLRDLYGFVTLGHELRDRLCHCAWLLDTKLLTPLTNSEAGQPSFSAEADAFEEFVGAWAAEVPAGTVASIVVFDVDRCGMINERLGVRTGDRILQAITENLNQFAGLRQPPARAARLDGQTFGLFFTDIAATEVARCAERVRQSIEATTFLVNFHEHSLTVSCGALPVVAGVSNKELPARIRRVLTTAKRGGRNRTSVEENVATRVVAPLPTKTRSLLIKVEDAVAI